MTITVKDKTGRPIVWEIWVEDGRWKAMYDGSDGAIDIDAETLAELDQEVRRSTKKLPPITRRHTDCVGGDNCKSSGETLELT